MSFFLSLSLMQVIFVFQQFYCLLFLLDLLLSLCINFRNFLHLLLNLNDLLSVLLLNLFHPLGDNLLAVCDDNAVAQLQVLSIFFEFFPHFLLIVKHKHIVFFFELYFDGITLLLPALSNIMHVLLHPVYNFLVVFDLVFSFLLQLLVLQA